MGTVRTEAKLYVKKNGPIISLSEFEGPISNGGQFISRDGENMAPQKIGCEVIT